MNKRLIIGELAGLCWLLADASWAIGDRHHIDNTDAMTVLFGLAILLALVFIGIYSKDSN